MNAPCERPIDPETAIWNRDLPELERSLAHGWSLPHARLKDGGSVLDLTLAIRIVSLRWPEGWRALTARLPALHAEPVLWQLALRRGVPDIVQDFLAHGQSPSKSFESGLAPIHVVAEALGPQPGEPIDEDDLIATVRILHAAGASPWQPCDGDFVSGGTSLRGHTLWTRAIYFRSWGAVEAFMPARWEDIGQQPRGAEMLQDLHRTVLSGTTPGAVRVWALAMDRWAEEWLTAHPAETFTMPPELEAITRLGPRGRAAVWKRWQQTEGSGWTPLHDLALSGRLDAAHVVLKLAIADAAQCLGLWTHRADDGMRPCDLWEIANGRRPESLADNAPDPARVPEILALRSVNA